MGMRSSITFTYERVKNFPDSQFLPSDMKADVWMVHFIFKGRELESLYVAKKGEFAEPILETVLNTMFNTAYLYRKYEHDFFAFVRHVGKGLQTMDRVQNHYEKLKQATESLKELFRNDFDKYDTYYRSLRDIEPLIERKFIESEMIDSLNSINRDLR